MRSTSDSLPRQSAPEATPALVSRMRGFRDRAEAGRLLAESIREYAQREDVLVLGLPRGGVPVAFEVAAALAAPLDLVMVRKLGVPGHEELALGAIATGGVEVLNAQLVRELDLPEDVIASIAARERSVLERREHEYRGERLQPEVAHRTVVLVNDGLATGATMLAAIRSVRARDAERVVVAVPVAPRETCAALRRAADVVACLITPANFRAVSAWYDDFSATTDDQVRELLGRSRRA